MGIKLEIGCGRHPQPGYEHLDFQPFPHVEYVADARKIPLPDNSCSEILTVHVIEHFWWTEIPVLLKEWYRIMEPGGVIITHTPDLDGCVKGWMDGSWKTEIGRPGYSFTHNTDKDRNMWLNHKLHGTEAPGNAHLTSFNYEMLRNCLAQAGFKDFEKFGIDLFTVSVKARK